MVRWLLVLVVWIPTTANAQTRHEEEEVSVQASEPLVRPAGIMDDHRIRRELALAAEAWLKEGKAVRTEELIRQLDRTECTLKLPRSSRWKMSSEKLVAKCQPGVLVLGHLFKCTNCPRYHVRTSTGFVLTRSGAIAAAYHAVNSPDDEAIVALTGDGRIAPVTEVLAASREADVVILQLAGQDYTALPLAGPAPVGSTVRVISHPGQSYYMFTQGILSRYLVQRKRSVEVNMMSITADFAKGSSGAPVFNERGAVIGMANNTRSIYYSMENGRKDNLQMVLKRCVPIQYLLDLIRAQ
jgi:S1-C subfamily serine protease